MISNPFFSRPSLHLAFTTPSGIQAQAATVPQDLQLLCHDLPGTEASILPMHSSASDAFMG